MKTMSTSSTSSRRPRALRLEIEDLLDESLRLSFPDLPEIADFITVKGDAFEMYGDDYQCPSVLHICQKLRAKDPFLFRKRGTKDIATFIMNNLRNSEMVQEVSLRGGCFLSFKLSWKWLAKRIQNMLDDGIDTWAPVYGLRRAAVKYPTGDMDLDKHADVFRSEFISNVLCSMLEYSGVDVIIGTVEQQSLSSQTGYVQSVVKECFLAEQGEFKARGKHGPPLFVGTAGKRGYINADIDLSRLWSSIMEYHADLILYITPVRRRVYVEKFITAAKDVNWIKDDGKCTVACCGYRTSSNEKRKLACVLNEFRNYSEAKSLVQLGKAAGYTCTAESFFEGALCYTYLRTPRLVDVTFSLDEMLNVKGNTLVYILNIQALNRSIIKESSHRKKIPYKSKFKLTKAVVAKERELAVHLVRFSDVIKEACTTVSPHMVCEYLYDLCRKFSSCYGEAKPSENRLMLCKATAVVMQHCFHLLCINLNFRRSLLLEKFLSSEGKVANVTCFNPWPVSDARPENPRFEMFSMFVSLVDPDFEEGYMSGCISVADTYGLLPDGWSRLFAGDIGHVAYFSRHWCDPLRISNEDFQFFGNPGSQHAVAFSSSLEIHVGLTITTKKKKDCKDACYHIYSEHEEKDKLSCFWNEDKKIKCDTLSYNSKDGILQIHYILLKDAVDTTIDIRFESRVPGLKGLKVSGHVIAYYGDGVLDEINESMQEFFKAIIFKPEGTCVTTGEKLPLKRSVLSVPATGCLMIESYLKDESGEVIVDKTEPYRAKPTGISEWAMHGEKGTFFLTVNWRKGPGIVN